MAPIEQTFVEHLLQRPPSGFNVVVVEGDVGVVEVNPVGHALGHLSPGGFVGPNGFPAGLVKLRHAEGFNRFIAHQIKSLLDFNFHGKAVGVPTAFSLDQEALHGLPAAYEVLVGASDHMVNSRFAVGRRRSFEEDERCVVAATVNGGLEGLLGGPLLQEPRFQIHGVQFTRR